MRVGCQRPLTGIGVAGTVGPQDIIARQQEVTVRASVPGYITVATQQLLFTANADLHTEQQTIWHKVHRHNHDMNILFQ